MILFYGRGIECALWRMTNRQRGQSQSFIRSDHPPTRQLHKKACSRDPRSLPFLQNKARYMRMKQSTNGQHWYDQLSSVYSIEEFPPLHSFSFNDWHWISDDDLINDHHQRPFKMISTAASPSSPNDVWTLIMDEQRTTEPALYSSIVQHCPPSSTRHPQQQPHSSSPAKVILLYRKNSKSTDVHAHSMVNDEDESQWSLAYRRHNQHRRRCRRSSIKPRPMQEFHREDTTLQDKEHLTRLPNKKKAPPLRQRRVQHRLRYCTHR